MAFDQWPLLAAQVPFIVAFMVWSHYKDQLYFAHLKDQAECDRRQRLESMATGLRQVDKLCVAVDKLIQQMGLIADRLAGHEVGAVSRHATLVEVLREKEMRHP